MHRLLAAVLFLAAVVLLGVLVQARLGRSFAPARSKTLAARPAPGQPLSVGLLFGERLDLNLATAADLEALPAIGPSRARAIVSERAARGGRFAAIEDLLAIPGIGEKTVAKLTPWLVVN